MALNFSHHPIFPSHISEDNPVSPMRIGNGCLLEEILERGGDRRKERGDRIGSAELSSNDIINLLPSDPFLMDISTTFTTVTGWLKDMQVDPESYSLVTGLNFTVDWALQFQNFPSNSHLGENSNFITDVMHKSVGPQIEVSKEVAKSAAFGGDDWVRDQALSYSLRFLCIRDLLSLELVCKSLHTTVQSDPLLWRRIYIDQPLNKKVDDSVLLQLAARAQGNLQNLSLIGCQMITDDGLRSILKTSPKLTKLCVPGCTGLSIEGIVNNLKAFNSKNKPGIKCLRIGGLSDIMDKHFEELKLLLGINTRSQQNNHNPHFYHMGNLYLSCENDRAIDIEACPKCQKLCLVYDCPSHGCQEKRDACRACWLCIPRCGECGCCLVDDEYEETFLLYLRCSCCSEQLARCPDGQDGENGLA